MQGSTKEYQNILTMNSTNKHARWRISYCHQQKIALPAVFERDKKHYQRVPTSTKGYQKWWKSICFSILSGMQGSTKEYRNISTTNATNKHARWRISLCRQEKIALPAATPRPARERQCAHISAILQEVASLQQLLIATMNMTCNNAMLWERIWRTRFLDRPSARTQTAHLEKDFGFPQPKNLLWGSSEVSREPQ